MLKVYLVLECDSLDYVTSRCVAAVYSTEEAAQAHCSEYNDSGYGDEYWCQYEEFELDARTN